MFRTITLTLAALFAFNAQAAGEDREFDLTLLNFSPLYEDDAAYLAKVFDCTLEKDGTCSVEVRGEEEAPAIGLYRPGRKESASIELIYSDEAAPSIGAMFVEEFEFSKDGSLMVWIEEDYGIWTGGPVVISF